MLFFFRSFIYSFFVHKGYYRKTEGYRLCTLHGKAKDDTSCSASLGSSPACLVCPISRVGQQGLSWKSSNETLFINTVRIRGDLNTYAVNECGPDNYTLSVSTSDLSNGGQYTCSLGMTTLAQFNLTINGNVNLCRQMLILSYCLFCFSFKRFQVFCL